MNHKSIPKASIKESKNGNESIFRKTGLNTIMDENNKKPDRSDYKNINENKKRDLKINKNNNFENMNFSEINNIKEGLIPSNVGNEFDSFFKDDNDKTFSTQELDDDFIQSKNKYNSLLKDSLFGTHDYLPREPNEEGINNNKKEEKNKQHKDNAQVDDENNYFDINNIKDSKDLVNTLNLFQTVRTNNDNEEQCMSLNSSVNSCDTADILKKKYCDEIKESKVNNSKVLKDNNNNDIKFSIKTNKGLEIIGTKDYMPNSRNEKIENIIQNDGGCSSNSKSFENNVIEKKNENNKMNNFLNFNNAQNNNGIFQNNENKRYNDVNNHNNGNYGNKNNFLSNQNNFGNYRNNQFNNINYENNLNNNVNGPILIKSEEIYRNKNYNINYLNALNIHGNSDGYPNNFNMLCDNKNNYNNGNNNNFSNNNLNDINNFNMQNINQYYANNVNYPNMPNNNNNFMSFDKQVPNGFIYNNQINQNNGNYGNDRNIQINDRNYISRGNDKNYINYGYDINKGNIHNNINNIYNI